MSNRSARSPQHSDEHRPEDLVLLAVDQELAGGQPPGLLWPVGLHEPKESLLLPASLHVA